MTSNLTLAKLFLVLAFVLLAIPPRRAYEICVCDSVLNANDPEAEPVVGPRCAYTVYAHDIASVKPASRAF